MGYTCRRYFGPLRLGRLRERPGTVGGPPCGSTSILGSPVAERAVEVLSVLSGGVRRAARPSQPPADGGRGYGLDQGHRVGEARECLRLDYSGP